MSTRSRRNVAVLVTAAALAAGSGVAYAYWTTSGTGTGTVSAAAAAQPVTAIQTTTITTIGPGVAAQTLAGTFNNPNTGPVYIASVTAAITGVEQGPYTGTCNAADFILTTPVMTVGHEIAAGNGVNGWTGAKISFNDTAANQDACKAARVTLTYTIA